MILYFWRWSDNILYLCRYHSYNRDYGLDCYEHDFIDDSEVCEKRTLREFEKTERKPDRRKRHRQQRGRGDIYSSESEEGGSPERGKRTPYRRGRKGSSRRRINISGSSSGSDSNDMYPWPHTNQQDVSKLTQRRYNGSEDEDEEVVVGGRKRRSRAQLESGSESSEEGGRGRRRGRKCRKLESDEEIRYINLILVSRSLCL